ncbi:MAG TPA: hemolysin family protein [Gemmatimonadales bacterium]|jgi:CBS domain containing-hemolysin-like protein
MDSITLSSFLLRLAAVVVLVAANAFFVAAEFALVASRRTRLDALVKRGDRKAKLARKAVQSLDKYISGTQLGITAASLGLGWIGEPALAGGIEHFFGLLPGPLDLVATHAVASTIAFLGITFLHIVLGELAPKALALLRPEDTSRWVAAPLILFTVATNPFIWVLNGSANLLLRLFGLRAPSEAERVHQPDEIMMLVRQTQRAGRLDGQDARMIEGVFEFTEKTARDVMTPRTEVSALPGSLTVEAAARRAAEVGRSRYPVYEESIDNVTGVVHVKQILAALRGRPDEPLAAMARSPLFVPGTREVEDVLTDMKRLKFQMAIVLDEYGGTAGIVTMEDLLEEIVGEIYDEYDRADPLPKPSADGVSLPGETDIEDVNTLYGLALSDADYQTIGGYVFGALGRLPRTGDQVMAGAVRFEVLSMDGRRVERVRMVLPPKPASSAPAS